MRKVEALIPAAITAVKNKMADDGNVNSAYKGYISSLGAGIIQSGLLPTLAMYKGNEGSDKKKANTAFLLEAIYEVVKSNPSTTIMRGDGLFEYALRASQIENNRQAVIDEILNASIAIKLAIRTFKMVES
jgi:CRISPR-associated protein Cmr5